MIDPGTTLGRYTIRQTIGAGGMGEVYLAFDPELERMVALKVLSADLAGDPARVARFVREAKAASALNHPNILSVFDAGTWDETRFLVTELVEGVTLREWAEQGKPRLVQVLDVCAQAASALAAAHEAGIVHRDIKPENLMLRRDGIVKVLDFGIAKLTLTRAAALDTAAVTAAQATHPGAVLGTVRYMSPEQASGLAVDARSDVWSLGVVLYELVAGKPPFAGTSPIATLAAILEREPESLERLVPDAPPSLTRLLKRALHKRPDERLASAADLAAELRRVAREIESGMTSAHEAETAAFAPATPTAPERQMPPTNLPTALSPIVGRDREVEEVTGLLRAPSVRLVTLTGPGGTGKTRLALEVARALLPERRDGVFAVDLSSISDPTLVPAHIGQALGVREAGDTPMSELLARHLRERELLLLVDTFEHLMAAAPLVAELLVAAPGLKVLVTSRAPLHLRLEREVAVEPLEVPDFGSLPPLEELGRTGAVALFVARTREVKPSFALTTENARAVVEICRRLDGLPLALELAAARAKLFAPQALLGKLEHGLKVLTGGARDLPGRQQTIRGTIAWSYDLLEPSERELLCRLAVFAGGCDYDAAESVCGTAGLDVFDGIGSLVDKSLLRQREQADEESRFRMLDLVREFALEQLEASGWAESARAEHARYFLRLAEEAEPELIGANEPEWSERLGREHDNLRAALSYLIERWPEEGTHLVTTLRAYWKTRSHFQEALSWFARALETGAATARVRVRLLAYAANMRRLLGDFERAALGARESLVLAKELGDPETAAISLGDLGVIAGMESRFDEARAHYEEVLALARAHNLRTFLVTSLTDLGWVANEANDILGAVRYTEEALEVEGRDACTMRVAHILMNLGGLRHQLGEVEEARACLREALSKARLIGSTYLCMFCVDALAAVAVDEMRLEHAATLAGAVEVQHEILGARNSPSNIATRQAYIEKLREALEPEALERAWTRGRSMGLEAAIAEALVSD